MKLMYFDEKVPQIDKKLCKQITSVKALLTPTPWDIFFHLGQGGITHSKK